MAQSGFTPTPQRRLLCSIQSVAARDSEGPVDKNPMETREVAAEFFAQRRTRADFKAFDKLMRRKGGEPPRDDDRID